MFDATLSRGPKGHQKTRMNTRPRLRAAHRAMLEERRESEKTRAASERYLRRTGWKVDQAMKGVGSE